MNNMLWNTCMYKWLIWRLLWLGSTVKEPLICLVWGLISCGFINLTFCVWWSGSSVRSVEYKRRCLLMGVVLVIFAWIGSLAICENHSQCWGFVIKFSLLCMCAFYRGSHCKIFVPLILRVSCQFRFNFCELKYSYN